MLQPTGKKTNHKKGIAAAAKVRRREEAEARNAEFQKLPASEKQARNTGNAKGKYECSQG